MMDRFLINKFMCFFLFQLNTKLIEEVNIQGTEHVINGR